MGCGRQKDHYVRVADLVRLTVALSYINCVWLLDGPSDSVRKNKCEILHSHHADSKYNTTAVSDIRYS